MSKKIENETIEMLRTHTSSDFDFASSNLDEFKYFLQDLYNQNEYESIESVVIGCAVFMSKKRIVRLFSDNKFDKSKDKFVVKISEVYLDLAKSYLVCVGAKLSTTSLDCSVCDGTGFFWDSNKANNVKCKCKN